MAGILFIISAPSGSGKSTLVNQVRTMVEGLDFSISYTTRQPRGSETDGREYHFTTRDRFEEMAAEGDFLESAEVFGNYYGTAVSALHEARAHGRDLILDIDVQGAMQVMKKMPEAVSIFILPPSPEVLEMRLRNRSASESNGIKDPAERERVEQTIARRLQEARTEVSLLGDYKYALVNDVLDQAAAEMRAIFLCERGSGDDTADGVLSSVRAVASSCRTDRPSERLSAALESFRASERFAAQAELWTTSSQA